MAYVRALLVMGALAGLVGCAGPEVRYDYDVKANFSSYKSYDWQAAPGGARGQAGGFDNAIMNGRVRRAVETELAAKGFRQEVSADPDFLVTYYPLRDPNRPPTRVHLGVGFGFGPLGVGIGAPVGDRHPDIQGSIVLEVQDFRSGAVVWKATAPGALQASDDPKQADADVTDAVHGMLKRFPPK